MKNEGTLQNLSDFENKSLLIVDDDNPFRERLARAMEKKGFQVIQAEGVQKGIRAKISSFARMGVNSFMTKSKISGNYINSVFAKREALNAGYDEALMLDSDG